MDGAILWGTNPELPREPHRPVTARDASAQNSWTAAWTARELELPGTSAETSAATSDRFGATLPHAVVPYVTSSHIDLRRKVPLLVEVSKAVASAQRTQYSRSTP